MTLYPKAFLALAAFAAAVLLAVDARLGVTMCVVAVIAYILIELLPVMQRHARDRD